MGGALPEAPQASVGALPPPPPGAGDFINPALLGTALPRQLVRDAITDRRMGPVISVPEPDGSVTLDLYATFQALKLADFWSNYRLPMVLSLPYFVGASEQDGEIPCNTQRRQSSGVRGHPPGGSGFCIPVEGQGQWEVDTYYGGSDAGAWQVSFFAEDQGQVCSGRGNSLPEALKNLDLVEASRNHRSPQGRFGAS
jgi:hypothetical protein